MLHYFVIFLQVEKGVKRGKTDMVRNWKTVRNRNRYILQGEVQTYLLRRASYNEYGVYKKYYIQYYLNQGKNGWENAQENSENYKTL